MKDGRITGDGKEREAVTPVAVNWQTVALSTFVSILVALLGSAATLAATHMANVKDREIRADQVRVAQQEAARTKRERVYQGFLEAANNMAVQADGIVATCHSTAESSRRLPTTCDLGQLINANYNLQGFVNEIHIYGTPAAVGAMRAVMAEIPGGPGADFRFKEVNHDRFTAAYSKFLRVMCEDVRPDPGQPCL